MGDEVSHDGAAVVYAMLALVAWAGVGLLLLSSHHLTKRSKKPEPAVHGEIGTDAPGSSLDSQRNDTWSP